MAVSTKPDQPLNEAIASFNADTPAGIDLAERIESVKAGLVGALAVGMTFGVVMLTNSWLLAPHITELAALQQGVDRVDGLISGAIALLSGFLFGITYRYIIRQDSNPHLRSGAVLAFGLVRGLAQVDTGWVAQKTLLPFAVLGVESILLFIAARILLDWVLYQRWIKPFGTARGEYASGASK